MKNKKLGFVVGTIIIAFILVSGAYFLVYQLLKQKLRVKITL